MSLESVPGRACRINTVLFGYSSYGFCRNMSLWSVPGRACRTNTVLFWRLSADWHPFFAKQKLFLYMLINFKDKNPQL